MAGCTAAYQPLSEDQKGHGHAYLLGQIFLSHGPQPCERFQGDVQKLLRKVRLLSPGLNSLYRDNSSTGIFFTALQIDRA